MDDGVHVLHVIKGLGPGGAERLLVSMAVVRSPDVRFSVAYLLPWKRHLVDELEALGAEVHLVGGNRGLADPRWLVRLAGLVRRTRPDVVHLHSPALAAAARPMLRALPGRPVVMSTEHNEWPSFDAPTRIANAVTRPLSDVHLAVSAEVRDSMSARHARRSEILVHGIPLELVASRAAERDEAREELGFGDDDVVVTIVANFRRAKDYPTLLRAASKARAEEPRLRFLSVGQGPLEAELRAERNRLDLGDGFRFLGYQPDPARILAASDLFTLTSRHEGLSIALLEALALGLPVVVSAVGGVRSVMAGLEGAELVPPGDVDAFAQAYVTLARDPQRREAMSRSAANHAKHFDIAGAQRWLEERYRHEIERRRN